jgi:DNA-binding transcriptional ArsR family regulator
MHGFGGRKDDRRQLFLWRYRDQTNDSIQEFHLHMLSARRHGFCIVVSADIYKLQTLDRAFAVLDLLASSSTSLAVGEVVEALQLHKSTVHRLLKVLERHRMVERVQNGKYRLGLRLCNLGSRAIEQYDLRERAHPASQDTGLCRRRDSPFVHPREDAHDLYRET